MDKDGAARRPGHLRLPAGRAGRDPLPQAARPVLAEHPPLRRLGRAVLRHRRTADAAARRTSTPRSAAPSRAPSCGRSPPRPTTRCGGRRTTRSVYTGQNAAAVGRRRARVRRPRHPRPAADLGRGHRPDALTEPAHIVTFGPQVHVKGILGGTEEAGRHIGYLTKYLTKSVGQAAGLDDDRDRAAARAPRRLAAELAHHAVLAALPGLAALRHPAQGRPTVHGARGCARARRTSPNTSASPAAASWSPASGRTRPSTDHRAERTAFVRQLLDQAPASGPATPSTTARSSGRRPRPGDPDVPTRPVLLLHAIHQRQRWRADYHAASTRGRRTTRRPFGNRGGGGMKRHEGGRERRASS